jgi:hypothetical protein
MSEGKENIDDILNEISSDEEENSEGVNEEAEELKD